MKMFVYQRRIPKLLMNCSEIIKLHIYNNRLLCVCVCVWRGGEGYEADDTFTSSIDVRNEWSYTFTPSYALWHVQR
jgi:hypothetical protein